MRGKVLLLLFIFVTLFGGMACSKKQTESSQAPQTPAAQTPASQTPASQTPASSPSQQASTAPAQPVQPPTLQSETAPAMQSAESAPEEKKAERRSAAAVPTGTALVVRLNNAVSSKTAKPGDTFTATLAKPVIVHGETVIPQGSGATGKVTDVKAAGKLAGAAQMGLNLTSVTVDGRSYRVKSTAIAQTSTGKGKRTAVLAGGGAALGGTLGGLAGGGKGAVVGLLAGGGAGTAGSAFTGNADITLPAESVLSFRLARPLDLSQSTTLSSSK